MNSKGIDHTRLAMTNHCKSQIRAKGFNVKDVVAALRNPYKVTEVRRYPGQLRFCGSGLAVVVNMKDATIVTVYLDGVRTALRPDQMSDPAALASKRALR